MPLFPVQSFCFLLVLTLLAVFPSLRVDISAHARYIRLSAAAMRGNARQCRVNVASCANSIASVRSTATLLFIGDVELKGHPSTGLPMRTTFNNASLWTFSTAERIMCRRHIGILTNVSDKPRKNLNIWTTLSEVVHACGLEFLPATLSIIWRMQSYSIPGVNLVLRHADSEGSVIVATARGIGNRRSISGTVHPRVAVVAGAQNPEPVPAPVTPVPVTPRCSSIPCHTLHAVSLSLQNDLGRSLLARTGSVPSGHLGDQSQI
ncbi:hypothetical protein B0H13DRAFT_1920937 [Mycena leptocephala]|nr:hypothetical protein B0H13DRAFT_1920937 [Mycena leptocephala]